VGIGVPTFSRSALAPEAPPTIERPMSEAQVDATVAVYLADTDQLCRAVRDECAA
jgi:hypothetical protein